jgi:hypothetical protein
LKDFRRFSREKRREKFLNIASEFDASLLHLTMEVLMEISSIEYKERVMSHIEGAKISNIKSWKTVKLKNYHQVGFKL